MGQIADDIMNGFQCSGCGICFEGEHGFAVFCRGCYGDDPKAAKRAGIPKATLPELGEGRPKSKPKKPKNGEPIIFEPRGTLTATISRMVNLAVNQHRNVWCEFNGVDLLATPDITADEMEKQYQDGIAARKPQPEKAQ